MRIESLHQQYVEATARRTTPSSGCAGQRSATRTRRRLAATTIGCWWRERLPVGPAGLGLGRHGGRLAAGSLQHGTGPAGRSSGHVAGQLPNRVAQRSLCRGRRAKTTQGGIGRQVGNGRQSGNGRGETRAGGRMGTADRAVAGRAADRNTQRARRRIGPSTSRLLCGYHHQNSVRRCL